MREKDIHIYIYIVVKFWGLPNQSFSFCPREIITEFGLYSSEQPVVEIDAILIVRLYNREIDQVIFANGNSVFSYRRYCISLYEMRKIRISVSIIRVACQYQKTSRQTRKT